MGSINYPTSPDWSNGRFYGPTSQQTTDFPNNVYLNPTEWHLWQLEAQLANTISASNSYASIATSLGLNVANPFTPSIAI
ncbi:MAG: hypothetical protein KGI50_07120, partial [Patescibacteria group bacterium]|nr:hypothetical protein [Patescibacteria group bacterium]